MLVQITGISIDQLIFHWLDFKIDGVGFNERVDDRINDLLQW